MDHLLLSFGAGGSWQLNVDHGSISYLWELTIDFILTSLSLLLISTRPRGRWQSTTKQTLHTNQESLLFLQDWGLLQVARKGFPVVICLQRRRWGSIPGLSRSPGGGNGNPLWYSCLDNSMDRGAWCATAHGVTRSWTQLSDWACTHKVVRARWGSCTDCLGAWLPPCVGVSFSWLWPLDAFYLNGQVMVTWIWDINRMEFKRTKWRARKISSQED